MRYSYKIIKDIRQDAWNWWNACNSVSHGVAWKECLDNSLQKMLVGKTEVEAAKALTPILNKIYKEDKDIFDKFENLVNSEFSKYLKLGFEKIVKAMRKPIYREDFTVFLTTMRRGPYDKEKGYVWICIYWSDPLGCFLHELCHFEFIHYWRENKKSDVSRLPTDQFEFLKESLTVILNEDFLPIIKAPDQGYDIHQELRTELKKHWKKHHDFDELVRCGIKLLPKYLNI